MTCSKTLPKYHKRLVVEIEVWVSHRSESSIMHISDLPQKDWRACVRHSDGKMEWQWCETFDEAVAWCERYALNDGSEVFEPIVKIHNESLPNTTCDSQQETQCKRNIFSSHPPKTTTHSRNAIGKKRIAPPSR